MAVQEIVADINGKQYHVKMDVPEGSKPEDIQSAVGEWFEQNQGRESAPSAPPGIAKAPIPRALRQEQSDPGEHSASDAPFFQRSSAGMKGLREGKPKDFLGNMAAAGYELVKPESETLAAAGLGGEVATGAKALSRGAWKPIAATVGGLAAYYGVDKAVRATGLPGWVAEPLAIAAGAAVGGPSAAKGVKGIVEKWLKGEETPGFKLNDLRSSVFEKEFGKAPETAEDWAKAKVLGEKKLQDLKAELNPKPPKPEKPPPPPKPGRSVTTGGAEGPTTPLSSSTRPELKPAAAPKVTYEKPISTRGPTTGGARGPTELGTSTTRPEIGATVAPKPAPSTSSKIPEKDLFYRGPETPQAATPEPPAPPAQAPKSRSIDLPEGVSDKRAAKLRETTANIVTMQDAKDAAFIPELAKIHTADSFEALSEPEQREVLNTIRNGGIKNSSGNKFTIASDSAKFRDSVERLLEKWRGLTPKAEGGPVKAPSSVEANAKKILDTVRELEPVKGVPVSTLRLRNALQGMSKQEFDNAAILLRKQQKAFLSQHADPYNLSPADQDLLIKDPSGTWHVAVAERPPSPVHTPAQIAAEMPKEAPAMASPKDTGQTVSSADVHRAINERNTLYHSTANPEAILESGQILPQAKLTGSATSPTADTNFVSTARAATKRLTNIATFVLDPERMPRTESVATLKKTKMAFTRNGEVLPEPERVMSPIYDFEEQTRPSGAGVPLSAVKELLVNTEHPQATPEYLAKLRRLAEQRGIPVVEGSPRELALRRAKIAAAPAPSPLRHPRARR